MSLKLLQLNFTPEPQTLNTSFWEVYTKFLKIKKKKSSTLGSSLVTPKSDSSI